MCWGVGEIKGDVRKGEVRRCGKVCWGPILSSFA